MSKTDHSPLPWRAEGSMEIHDADGTPVGECWQVGDDPFRIASDVPDPGDVLRANRDLIVRAVNAHARLVRTVRGLLMSADAMWEEKGMGHDWAAECRLARALLESIKEQKE